MSICCATPTVKPMRDDDRPIRRNKNLVTLADFGISYIEEINAVSINGGKIATWYTKEDKSALTFVNCRNCGAPVKGHKCEYCETRY